MTISIPTSQAHSAISLDLRNSIYSALLSGPGIRTIEATLDEALRSTGFRDQLKTYITFLFRSGQATTAEDAYRLAMERIRLAMADEEGANGSNGNGSMSVEDGGGLHLDAPDVQLKVPQDVVAKGTKVVMRELGKVCEITYQDEK